MNITSAKFIKGIVEPDAALTDGIPQVAFIGRSNVGKSSIINAITKQKELAKTSSFPGHTQEINLFLVNKLVYLVDLPGYGFARISRQNQERIRTLIQWYLLHPLYEQKKVILIVDAHIGPTDSDIDMLHTLEMQKKNMVIVANKVDKIKPSQYTQKLHTIEEMMGHHRVIPFSSKKGIGIKELIDEVLR